MPITSVDGWSTTANLNSDVNGNNIAENCSPAGINNAMREMMAQVAATPLAETAATMRTNLGLGNVNNTSDANKPVSTAQQTALDLKANLAAPTFTGVPAAPTAAPGTNTTQLATTAFVVAGDALKADKTGTREKLTADRTYYVSTTGNNSNDGLTVGTPFLTLQKASNVIFGSLDLGGFVVTVQLADGTYTTGVTQSSPQVGAGSVVFNGNSGTPANVIINVASSNCFAAVGGASLLVQNMEFRNTVSGYALFVSGPGSKISTGPGTRFGACVNGHMIAQSGAEIIVGANYAIVGGGAGCTHFFSQNGGYIECVSRTVTITTTPAFAPFAIAEGTGVIVGYGNTFSGATTGQRYLVQYNGYIHTNGGGASYFPGSVAGAVSTGGQYR